MRLINITIVLFLFALTLNSQPEDYQCEEKIELINKLLRNPMDCENIIKNSEFYSDSFYLYHSNLFDYYRSENLYNLSDYEGYSVMVRNLDYSYKYTFDYKSINMGVIKRTKPAFNDDFTLNYMGPKYDIIQELTFPFVYKDGKWYLGEIAFARHFYLFTVDNIDFLNNFYDYAKPTMNKFRTLSTIEKQNVPYLNDNYQSCEKFDFISQILIRKDNLDSIFNNSPFTKNIIYPNNEMVKTLREYIGLEEHIVASVINYPFPVQNKFIDEYINSNNRKDYFIVEYRIEDYTYSVNKKKYSVKPIKYLTFEFEEVNSQWRLSNILKGTQVCFGLNRYEYAGPYKE